MPTVINAVNEEEGSSAKRRDSSSASNHRNRTFDSFRNLTLQTGFSPSYRPISTAIEQCLEHAQFSVYSNRRSSQGILLQTS